LWRGGLPTTAAGSDDASDAAGASADADAGGGAAVSSPLARARAAALRAVLWFGVWG
jgi:hypothetical protein